jgi:two-component system OmpR family sensor kinase
VKGPRRPHAPRSLRGRLLAGVVLLVAAGLLGADLAGYLLLRSFFDQRAERQLTQGSQRVERALARSVDEDTMGRVLQVLAPVRFKVAILKADQRPARFLPAPVPADSFPAVLDDVLLAELRERPGHVVRRELGGEPFRLLYHPIGEPAGARGGTSGRPVGIVVAVSTRRDEDTLHRIAVTELAVSSVTLLAAGGLALGVLRLGLRPLDRVTATAAAIAAGDTAQRIPVRDPRTELGRLAVVLNQAFDERRRAEERLRHFLADASHELRTPLTTISGWADLYFQDDLGDPDDVETAMARIADEAGHMRILVDDLMLLARLDRQRPPRTAPVDLAALVEDILSDARVIAPDRAIRCEVASPDGVTVLGDAERLRQVVRNLVHNALQHTPDGTAVTVTIAASEGPPPGVELVVADGGPGIPPETAAQLFDRFDGDRTRRTGSGLGLAISRAIVEAHGGTIGVRSSPGDGSEFHVTFPATRSARVADQAR